MSNLKNTKKAQITIFIIIALCLIIAGALILHYLSNKPEEVEQASDLNLKRDAIYSSIRACLESTTLDAIVEYGIKEDLSEPLIKQYIIDYLPICTDHFKTFETEGFSVTKGKIEPTVTINEDSLIVELNYPLTFTKNDATISFDKDIFIMPRKITDTLSADKDIILVSSNKRTQFIALKGTEATLEGQPITQIGMELLDREDNGRTNAVVAGMIIFKGTPEGAQFTKPITIIHQYSQLDVPSTVDETELTLAYYSEKLGVWVAIPTTVDTVNNILKAQTTHFTDFGMVIRCTEDQEITEHATLRLVQEDCQNCGGWNNGNAPADVGVLWIKSEAITQGTRIGEVSECKKTVIPSATDPPVDETYYSYEAIAIEGISTNATTKYAADGNSCIWTKENREPKIVVQDTANPSPGEDWDILLNASCPDGKDQCLIPSYAFGDSILNHTLKVVNAEAQDSCIRGKILVKYKGFGIQKDNNESYYLCDTEGEEKQMPIIGGTPTQSILSTCVCKDEVCKWTPKEGEEIKDDPIIRRENIKAYTGDGFQSCPDDFEEKYLGVVFTTSHVLDTRTRGDFTDGFGDYPFMQYESSLQGQFDKTTELLVFGSALKEGQCWLLVEAQKRVEVRQEKPDFYVPLSQVQAAIDGTEVPEENENPYTGGTTGGTTPGTPNVGSTTKCGETDSVEGIDISHWQGTIDWDKVAADDQGVKFALIKASEATDFVDDQFSRNWVEAKRVGILRGAYHYMRPGQGKAQAEHFLSVLGSDYGELPPILDLEESGVSPADLKAWLEEVEKQTGRVPMIYTSPGYWSSFGGGSEFTKYRLWVAQWEVSCPRVPTTWSNWDFWQYCGNCANPVDGIISSGLDLNVFNGNLDELRAYSPSAMI